MSAWCPNIFIYLCGNISQIWSWREVCTDWSACGTADCSLSLLVKLHRSPTQNAWVSVLHTAAGSERDSVVVRMKHSYLYNQISVNTWHQVMTTWVTRESLLFLLKLTWYFFFFFFFFCWWGAMCSIVPVRTLPLCSHMQEHTGHTWNCHYVLSLRCSRCPRCDPVHWNDFWEFWKD